MELEKKWNIEPDEIRDKEVADKFMPMWNEAKSMMRQRTRGHEIFSLVSHNKSLYKDPVYSKDIQFSEGSTQAIKRKLRAQTIQRVPDGEVTTSYDKNSIEQVEIEFLFKNKVLQSEYDGRDMLKNLLRVFNASYDYGYGCVLSGFERDVDGDYRTTFNLVQWNDIYPAPDCDFIEEANWYMVREYVSQSDLKQLIDCETGEIADKTYEEKTVKYLVENQIRDGVDPRSAPLADAVNGAFKFQSIETWTLYKRGSDEFITFVPAVFAVLRRVKNYDPRKDVPLHFLILEPDPEFPLGVSSIMWTLSHQQFADAFQTVSYQTLLLALNPPVMAFGNLTSAKLSMKPRTVWNMGTNPNNKIEKFPVETTALTQYGATLQNVSANMMKNLNVMDGTIASDANTMNYSATPQGVEQQQADRTITVNQYRKAVELFFSGWANHALRSYINAMHGEHEMLVNEETRRKIWDIEIAKGEQTGGVEYESIINGDKIKIDFDKLSPELLEFRVRTGSLIESEKETQRKAIQELIIPLSQMLGNLSDENRQPFEENIMQLVQRLCELSDVDIPQQAANRIGERLIAEALQATMEQVMGQQQQLNGMQQQMGTMAQAMPPEVQQQLMQQQAEQQEIPIPEQGMPQAQPPEAAIPLPQPEVSAEFPEAGEGIATNNMPVIAQ